MFIFALFSPQESSVSSKTGLLFAEHLNRISFQGKSSIIWMFRVGIFTYYDLLDCICECVKNTLCLSINMAAFEGADRRLWCDLLSSDKYRNAENFKENLRKHKFASFLYNGKDDFSSFFFQWKWSQNLSP